MVKEGGIFRYNRIDTPAGFRASESGPLYGRCFYGSLLDLYILKAGGDTEDIPSSYVIFIRENDVMKGNQQIYPVERYVTIGENKVLFCYGPHILYVNGKYRGNDEAGKLMHDFSYTSLGYMNYGALAKKQDNLRKAGKTNYKKLRREMKE